MAGDEASVNCSSSSSTDAMSNRQLILVRYANGLITENNFDIQEESITLSQVVPGSGRILLKTLWASVDPYLRGRMNEHAADDGLCMPPFELGKPIPTFIVSKVIASDKPEFHVGEIVVAFCGLAEYVLMEGEQSMTKVDQCLAPLSYHIGLLGLPGFTAWIGLKLIGDPRPGEQVFVSAAAGAVGIVVGQLAKLKGCRVVGSVGSDEKVEVLKKEFNFDDAFNYKKEVNWDATLGKYFPQGIDLYFENVGGRMLEAVLNHIRMNGRIAVCGMISGYNQEWTERDGVRNLLNMVGKCIRMQGFLVGAHRQRMPEFIEEMAGYVKEGKIKYKEHVTEGLENFAKSFIGMMNGENLGKAILHISDA